MTFPRWQRQCLGWCAHGYTALGLVAAAAIFYFGNQIDNNIPFIQGIADLIVRIVIGLIALAVLVSGYTALFSDPERRSWPDKLAGTLVLRKR